MADLNASILKQVEYYFSDFNLPKDKFLQEELATNDGWARISTLTSFVRLKKLSDDVEVIANALRGSEELLEVSEDGLKVRRKTEVPTDIDIDARTVYIKGFDQDKTLDDVTAFLAEHGYNPKSIRLRYFKDSEGKKFRGSVFATFATEEEAKEVAAKGIEYYIFMMKSEYDGEKAGAAGDDPKDKFAPTELVPDCLFKIDGLTEGIRRETIKEWVEKVEGKVAYTDYSQGEATAIVRVAEDSEVKAKEIVEKLTAIADEIKAANNDTAVTVTVIEGEEEKTLWETIEKAKAEKRDNFKRKPRGGNKFGNKRARRN